MIRRLHCFVLLAAAVLAPATVAAAGDPVNAMCPIGKEPIQASAGTLDYKGRTLGFCCPGCSDAFLAWDESRRDAFVVAAMAGTDADATVGGDGAPTAPATSRSTGGPSYPWTLDICIVTGAKLGSMGDPIMKTYEGREIRFCCTACIAKFEADSAGYWKQADAKLVAQQRMHYPLEICIVTARPLGADVVDHIHANRLVRLADADAAKAFAADPARHLKALDARIIADQLAAYPLEKCPIGGPLGSMGEPVNMVIMNRLVRLCCASCIDGVNLDPAKVMVLLDAGYAAAQRDRYPLSTCVVAENSRLGSMGEPIERVAGTTLLRFCCAGCLPAFEKDPATYVKRVQDARDTD